MREPGVTDSTDPRKRGCVLVVGDFVVDEHWACGVHRSPHTTRAGRSHMRVLSPVDSSTKALAGAPLTARFLHEVGQGRGDRDADAVIGMGFWRRGDDQALKGLFDDRATANNLYSLSAPALDLSLDGFELLNMHEAYDGSSAKEYTTRVIRMYENRPGGHVEFSRLDWEPRDPHERGTPDWNSTRQERLNALLKERLVAVGAETVTAVVLCDLRKGVVTKAIVEWLKLNAPSADWYVSTKHWRPKWLRALPRGQVRLFVVPQAPAEEAVTHADERISNWLTRQGRLTREAIKRIDELKLLTDCNHLVVLPHGFSAISWSRDEDAMVHPEEKRTHGIDFGIAGMVFSAVIAGLRAKQSCGGSVELALELTRKWTERQTTRITEPDIWRPQEQTKVSPLPGQVLLSECRKGAAVHPVPQERLVNWADASANWDQAYRELGMVGPDERKQLQLWRAMVELDGYVCMQETRRIGLNSLVQSVNAFARTPRRHEGCLLLGEPGSGKTSLAKQLASGARLRFEEFNLTQIRSRSELSLLFSKIRSVQSNWPRDRLLVFVDEINQPVDGPVYGAFLTPLGDGTFVRDGNLERLDPCFWVFAGTEFTKRLEDKSKDFESRLTAGILSLSAQGADWDPELARVEQVYVGASCIKREFPEVTVVSRSVLAAFRSLPPGIGLRSIRQFVERFQDVQFGGVTSRNLPPEDRWPRDEDNRTVGFAAWQEMKNAFSGPEVANVRLTEP